MQKSLINILHEIYPFPPHSSWKSRVNIMKHARRIEAGNMRIRKQACIKSLLIIKHEWEVALQLKAISEPLNFGWVGRGAAGAAAKMTSVEQLHPLCWDAQDVPGRLWCTATVSAMLFSQGPWTWTCLLIPLLAHPTFNVIQAVPVEAEV